jgi:hypothetical protein
MFLLPSFAVHLSLAQASRWSKQNRDELMKEAAATPHEAGG